MILEDDDLAYQVQEDYYKMEQVEDWQLDIDAMTIEQAVHVWRNQTKRYLDSRQTTYLLGRITELKVADPVGWASAVSLGK